MNYENVALFNHGRCRELFDIFEGKLAEVAEDPLLSALDLLLGSSSSMQEGRGARRQQLRAQAATLSGWAEANGIVLTEEFVSDLRPVASGAEHEVFFQQDKQRAVKITRAGSFGHTVAGPGLSATPAEYFLRWALHNALFGDSARLVGIIPDDVLRIAIS